MFGMMVIGVIAALVTVGFIIAEINQCFDNFERLTTFQKFLPWNIIIALSPILVDIGITLGIVWLFGMSGQNGMVISMIASAMISGYLYFRRKKKNQVVC
jgi:LPXTG-motif cell wall-anchored protein